MVRLVFRQISAVLDQLKLRCANVSTGLNLSLRNSLLEFWTNLISWFWPYSSQRGELRRLRGVKRVSRWRFSESSVINVEMKWARRSSRRRWDFIDFSLETRRNRAEINNDSIWLVCDECSRIIEEKLTCKTRISRSMLSWMFKSLSSSHCQLHKVSKFGPSTWFTYLSW